MSLPDVQRERVDFESFENQFRIVLRDTQIGISILMTASVPALISLAHAMMSGVHRIDSRHPATFRRISGPDVLGAPPRAETRW